MAKTTKKPAKEVPVSAKPQPITKDMLISDVVQKYPDTAEVMFKNGMHCIGCHIAHFETVEQGAAAHRINVDKFIKELNEAAKKKPVKEEDSDS